MRMNIESERGFPPALTVTSVPLRLRYVMPLFGGVTARTLAHHP